MEQRACGQSRPNSAPQATPPRGKLVIGLSGNAWGLGLGGRRRASAISCLAGSEFRICFVGAFHPRGLCPRKIAFGPTDT